MSTPTQHLVGEVWRQIPGFSRYSVSSAGRVRRDVRIYRTQPGLCSVKLHEGYPRTSITSDEGRCVAMHVHVLLMLAFVGPRPDGMHVCHGDGDSTNCTLGNLRYDTPAGNVRDAMEHGTHAYGERIAQHRLVEAEVLEIVELLDSNHPYPAIAAQYGVSKHAIFRIACGKNWKHLTGGKDRRNGYANSARNLVAAQAAKRARVVQVDGKDLMREKCRVWEAV